MPNSIEARVSRLMEQLTKGNIGKITVIFADGTRRLMDGGECVDLVMRDPGNVSRFEGNGPGCGFLPDLLNGLLEF